MKEWILIERFLSTYSRLRVRKIVNLFENVSITPCQFTNQMIVNPKTAVNDRIYLKWSILEYFHIYFSEWPSLTSFE